MDRYLGQHLVQKLIDEMPGLAYVREVTEVHDLLTTWSFFGRYLIYVCYLLSEFSAYSDQEFASKGENALKHIIGFIERCEKFQNEQEYEFGDGVFHAFMEGLYLAETEHDRIAEKLSPELRNRLAELEEAAGMPAVSKHERRSIEMLREPTVKMVKNLPATHSE